MSYLNDPREMAIRPESGITLEEDNRYETMYHWGAHVLDLCDLPVEEYMKPMTINVNGGGGGEGGGDTGSTNPTYFLKFVLDGVTKKSYNLEEGAPIPEVSGEKEGYDFSGWKDASGETYTSMPAANLTLYGTNTIKKFNVSFRVDNEALTEYDQVVEWGKKVTSIPSSSKTGYVFSGWEPAIPSTIKDDYVFNGSFTKKSYTITFNISGAQQTATVEYGDTIEYPAADSKVGYVICGWTPYYETMPDVQNLVFKAVLSAIPYTVTFYIDNGNGGDLEVVTAYTLTMGQTIPSVAKPAASGYSFTNWSADTQVTNSKMPASDVNYYSVRSTNSYTLKYFIDGAQSGATETHLYGEALTIREKFEKEGYTVTDWAFSPALDVVPEELGGGYSMPYRNVTGRCTTSINSYPVVITCNGEVIYSGNVTYGTSISSLVPAGYSYTGSPANVPANAVNVEADINTYNVTVTINGTDTVVIPLEYKSDILSAVEEYIENNYPMTGHHIETNIPNGATVPASDTAYTASVVPNVHNATVSGAGNVQISYGENVADALEDVIDDLGIDEYHYFDGWELNGQPLDENYVMPDEDITIVPVIRVKEAEVTPVVSGETGESATTYDYGTPIADVIDDIVEGLDAQTQEDLEDPGYQVDWTVNGSAYTPDMVVKEDEVTVEVSITPKPFALSFMRRATAAAPAGVIESGQTLYKEEIVYPELPANIEVSGVTYEFKWDDGSIEEGTPMPSRAVVVYGEYVEKPMAKTVYYGMVRNADILAMDDDDAIIASLSTYPEFPSDGKIEFVLTGDSAYFTHYDEDSDEEFEAYLLQLAKQPMMLLPSSINLAEYTGKRGLETIRTITKGNDIKINGADYTVWYENKIDSEYFDTPGYFVSDGSATWNLQITFTK